MYRKRKGIRYDTWHWRPDCHLYPTSDYVTRTKKPNSGELCNHCQKKVDEALETARKAVRRLRER